MAYTKASQKAVDRYIHKNYDTFSIRFPKGERDKIKRYAESKGMNMSEYIKKLIDADMNK